MWGSGRQTACPRRKTQARKCGLCGQSRYKTSVQNIFGIGFVAFAPQKARLGLAGAAFSDRLAQHFLNVLPFPRGYVSDSLPDSANVRNPLHLRKTAAQSDRQFNSAAPFSV